MFGELKELTLDCCVYEDMKYYFWVQIKLKSQNWNRDPSVTEISQPIVDRIKYI